MSVYGVLVFLHVTGAIAVFVGVGTLLIASLAMRRAIRVEQVRAIATPITAGRRVMHEWVTPLDVLVMAGIFLIAFPGFYMAFTTWGFGTAWIDVSLAGFALAAPVGPLAITPRLRVLAAAARETVDGPVPDALRALTHDPVLGTSLQGLTALLVGIVFLMSAKPSLGTSVVAMLVAVAAGVASALPLWRVRPRVAA